jgi:hypothetical protein
MTTNFWIAALLLCLPCCVAYRLRAAALAGPPQAQLPAATPGPRATHALVYDERRRRVVLLDGTWPAIQPESAQLPWLRTARPIRECRRL